MAITIPTKEISEYLRKYADIDIVIVAPAEDRIRGVSFCLFISLPPFVDVCFLFLGELEVYLRNDFSPLISTSQATLPSFRRVRLRKRYLIVFFAQDDTFGAGEGLFCLNFCLFFPPPCHPRAKRRISADGALQFFLSSHLWKQARQTAGRLPTGVRDKISFPLSVTQKRICHL